MGIGSRLSGVLAARFCRKGAVFAACAILSACAMTDGTVDARYESINRSTDSARNQAILFNIVRASQAEPLNFVAFSKIGGTTSTGMGMGLPAFQAGPDRAHAVTFGNNTLNANVGANTTFDISVLENKDFYSALLAPVDHVTLNFFLRQGYSRELLFWLFADSVRVTEHGRTTEYRNDPSDAKSCEPGGRNLCFVNYVDAAIEAGFSVETREAEKRETTSDGRTRTITKIEARPCFDPVLAERARREIASGLRVRNQQQLSVEGVKPICGKTPWPEKNGTNRRASSGNSQKQEKEKDASPNSAANESIAGDKLILRHRGGTRSAPARTREVPPATTAHVVAGQQVIEIPTRSTYAIYQYLGRILAENAMAKVRLDGTSGREDAQVLTITDQAGSCFTEMDYLGKHYCVPAEGAENTKRIIGLLSQLLALKTPQTELPFTPTVRVVQ